MPRKPLSDGYDLARVAKGKGRLKIEKEQKDELRK